MRRARRRGRGRGRGLRAAAALAPLFGRRGAAPAPLPARDGLGSRVPGGLGGGGAGMETRLGAGVPEGAGPGAGGEGVTRVRDGELITNTPPAARGPGGCRSAFAMLCSGCGGALVAATSCEPPRVLGAPQGSLPECRSCSSQGKTTLLGSVWLVFPYESGRLCACAGLGICARSSWILAEWRGGSLYRTHSDRKHFVIVQHNHFPGMFGGGGAGNHQKMSHR